MKTRKVELVANPKVPHFVGDGFRVHNFIPSGFKLSMQRMDPFIMLDYNSTYHFPPADTPKGVGAHPHRGFETVTVAYKGRVAPADYNTVLLVLEGAITINGTDQVPTDHLALMENDGENFEIEASEKAF